MNMSKYKVRSLVTAFVVGVMTQALSGHAHAQPAITQISSFTVGDLVVAVEGNGPQDPTQTYADNQGAPLTLYEYGLTGTTSATMVGGLILPQAFTGANGNMAAANGNFPISGEYGSSSEGTLQLSGNGQYLTIMGYGVNAATYNSEQTQFNNAFNSTSGANPTKIALGQTCSLSSCIGTGGSNGSNNYAVPRVVALIGANGSVNTTTAVYNVFNDNNPRSAYTVDGTSIYISGQGNSPDNTGGVFYTTLGSQNPSVTPTSITGADAGSGTSQETNEVQIYNNTLYVSTDSKEGATNRDFIGTLGTAGSPPTTLANGGNGQTMLPGYGSSNGHGTLTISGNGNGLAGQNGKTINLSPQNYFFANSTTLYVADSGVPKNSGGSNSTLGDGGLQKWSLISGSWVLDYTLSAGLGLVANTSTDGVSGLYGLTGEVVGGQVELFATSYVLADTDQTYLYGITDTLSDTTASQASGETFSVLDTAPTDADFKGVAFAPEAATPLPAALPLFAGGLGVMGLLTRRRKRNPAAIAAA